MLYLALCILFPADSPLNCTSFRTPNPSGLRVHPSLVSSPSFLSLGRVKEEDPERGPCHTLPSPGFPHSPVPGLQLWELPASVQSPSRCPHPRLPPPTGLLRSLKPPCGLGCELHPTPPHSGWPLRVQASLDFGHSSPSLPGHGLHLHEPQPWSTSPTPTFTGGPAVP